MADTAERLYRTMVAIRGFETSSERLLKRGELTGNVHLSIGQEAVAAGVCDVLRRDDHITTTHRGHGHCLAKGGDPERMFAELLGRATGYCGGKAGSMHIADPATGNLGATAIVGGGIAMAAGAALSAQVRGTDAVAVAFFGEGAVAEGSFHEALNLAAVWDLPLVLVCENNGYAELTPVAVHLRAQVHRARDAPRHPGRPRGRQRRARGPRGRRRARWHGRAPATARRCWSAPPTAGAATTSAIPSGIARRRRSRLGAGAIPSRGWRRSSARRAPPRSTPRWTLSCRPPPRRALAAPVTAPDALLEHVWS